MYHKQNIIFKREHPLKHITVLMSWESKAAVQIVGTYLYSMHSCDGDF